MKQEKKDASPFAEMTFQAQQDKWREWRSRQWDFRSAAREAEKEEEPKEQNKAQPAAPAPVRPAPTRHRELDRVLSRHKTALQKAGAFCSTIKADPPDTK